MGRLQSEVEFYFHSDVKMWLEEEKNFMEIKQVFDSTSRLVQQLKLRIFLYYFQLQWNLY